VAVLPSGTDKKNSTENIDEMLATPYENSRRTGYNFLFLFVFVMGVYL